jgi:hypothetical protein
MGHKLNEIRRKISRLRAEMLSLQEAIRVVVNEGLDWSEMALRLVAMRTEMADLIRQRNAMGGIEASPDIAERLKQKHRPELRRRFVRHGGVIAKEKPGRGRAPSM